MGVEEVLFIYTKANGTLLYLIELVFTKGQFYFTYFVICA